MNPFTINLIICLTGTILWIFMFTLYSVKNSMAKRKLENEGKGVEKTAASYKICIIVCGIVCALPYLILFKPYITAVLEGCGVLGTLSIMKERFEKLSPKE